jgi:thiamine biosynthesis lipoprotein
MLKSAIIMGTGVTLDIPEAGKEVFEAVFNLLNDIDSRFSTYKPNSEVSRYARGEVSRWRLSRDLRAVIKGCQSSEAATSGAFSAYASGTFDPSGYVKGWAIDKAARLIEKRGFNSYCLSIGGDIKAASNGQKVWRIGIQDPARKSRIITRIGAKNLALATSGNYERGAHIINPKTRKPATGLLSVTVAGPSIITADVLATAAFVLGDFALNFIGGQAKGYEALIVDSSGRLHATPGFDKFLA